MGGSELTYRYPVDPVNKNLCQVETSTTSPRFEMKARSVSPASCAIAGGVCSLPYPDQLQQAAHHPTTRAPRPPTIAAPSTVPSHSTACARAASAASARPLARTSINALGIQSGEHDVLAMITAGACSMMFKCLMARRQHEPSTPRSRSQEPCKLALHAGLMEMMEGTGTKRVEASLVCSTLTEEAGGRGHRKRH